MAGEQPEEKVVFALANRPDGQQVLVLGIPRKAWEYMSNGMSHTFDLNRYGFPVQLVMFGGETHEEMVETLTGSGMPFIDARNKDHGIK